MLEEKDNEKNKKIEIVKGSSKDLNISEVRDNLTFENHKSNTKENIVIPEVLETENEDKED